MEEIIVGLERAKRMEKMFSSCRCFRRTAFDKKRRDWQQALQL